MDKSLKKDRETIIEEWGDLPFEARLYLVLASISKRLSKMTRKAKAVVIIGTLFLGTWVIWYSIAVLQIEPWPLALVSGVLIGLIIGVITKL